MGKLVLFRLAKYNTGNMYYILNKRRQMLVKFFKLSDKADTPTN